MSAVCKSQPTNELSDRPRPGGLPKSIAARGVDQRRWQPLVVRRGNLVCLKLRLAGNAPPRTFA